jgi:hypothetical protein
MTGQKGVHSRFESVLFERFSSRLQFDPKPLPPATDARALMFESVLAGHQLVEPLLAADREASAGKETYDDDYYEKFFAKVRPMLEQQISLSISRTAAFLAGAWEQAGRPPLKTEVPRPVQKVRGAR